MPYITYFCVICAAISYVRFASLVKTEGRSAAALSCGALGRTNIEKKKEYWRFLLAGFVHFSIWHLLMNLYAMYTLGTMVEMSIGHMRFIILFFGSVITGNFFAYIMGHNYVCGGLSGGLYGLLALYITVIVHQYGWAGILSSSTLLYCIGINVLLNFMPGTCWQAHAGGACFGILYTLAVMMINGTY